MRGLWGVIVAGLCLAGPAAAGSKGGIYDFNYFLGQPHPFSGQQVGVGAAGSAPPYPPATRAPVPYPSYGPSYGVAAAPPQPQPQARDEEAGLFDAGSGWLDNWYVRAGGGYDRPDDLDDNAAGTSVNIDVDDGYMAEVAIGRYFSRSFRAELEFAYRATEFTDATAGGTTTTASGDYKVYSGMLNGFYDLDFDFPIVPYLGAGIGAAYIDVDSVTIGGVSTQSDTTTEFAYQGIVGLSWRFYERFVATIDYRYFATTGDNENATMTLAAGLRLDL